MSKSYKKTPYAGEKKGKAKKRLANHIVRRSLKRDNNLVVQGGSFKKLYESWNICDFGWTYTWKEYWTKECSHYNKVFKPNKQESYRQWKKWYYNK